MLASAPLLPKFVSEGAAMYHELRKRGNSMHGGLGFFEASPCYGDVSRRFLREATQSIELVMFRG
jgi:hypothetical protein